MIKQLLVALSFALISSSGATAQVQTLELLGSWSDSSLVSSRFYDNTYNEIWGLAIGGREYAVIGSTAGTHFIDVTDPAAAREVQFVAGAAQGTGIVHRDYHDYRGYLYAVRDEGPSTLQIMDIRGLPDTVTMVYESNAFFSIAHNIFIDSSRAKLYVHIGRGGSAYPGSPMQLLDISEPDSPRYVAGYNRFGLLSVSQVHDGYIENDTAYLNCGPAGFAHVDFSDPQNPQTLSVLTPNDYPFAGYNHSGWPSCDGKYYYMADENHGYDIKIIDMADRTDPKVAGTFSAVPSDSNSIPHNQLVACNYLYVSYYYDGLQVFDISDPATPLRVAHYPSSSEPNKLSYKGAWGVYPFLPSGHILVSDMQEGLMVLEGMGDNCFQQPACGIVNSTQIASTGALSLFPNPASGDMIQWQGIEAGGEAVLTISNMSGQRLFQENIRDIPSEGSIFLREKISAGMYLVHITTPQKRYTGTWLVTP